MGPWAAFLSVKAKGQRLQGPQRRALLAEYRALTHDELQEWREEGWRRDLQRRQAASESPEGPLRSVLSIGQVLESEAILTYCPGSTFEERWDMFSKQLRQERRSPGVPAQQMVPAKDITQDAAASEPSLAEALLQYGGPGLQQHLRAVPQATPPRLCH